VVILWIFSTAPESVSCLSKHSFFTFIRVHQDPLRPIYALLWSCLPSDSCLSFGLSLLSFKMISLLSLLSLVPYFLATSATDSTACISGTCTYQSGDGSNTAWSVLAIVGSFLTTPVLIYNWSLPSEHGKAYITLRHYRRGWLGYYRM
jgi:hypothetical protein